MKSTPDNPAKALDALVQALLERNTLQVTELVQGIYRQGWELNAFANPHYANDLHQALAASVLEAMVEVWEEPVHGRRDAAPAWCETVPAASEPFSLMPPTMQAVFAREPKNPDFAKRRIDAPAGYLRFC